LALEGVRHQLDCGLGEVCLIGIVSIDLQLAKRVVAAHALKVMDRAASLGNTPEHRLTEFVSGVVRQPGRVAAFTEVIAKTRGGERRADGGYEIGQIARNSKRNYGATATTSSTPA
jgi:hypothetical protein